MNPSNLGALVPIVRAWLDSDRALGMRHYACPPISPGAVSAGPRETARRDPPPAVPPERRAISKPARRESPEVNRAAPAPSGLPQLLDDAGLPPFCREELTREQAQAELEKLDRSFVRACAKCRLHEQRTQTVFGVGHPRARLCFVGEGPGGDEDRVGEPFVGAAGQLLTRMIAAMTLTRDQVYICNIVKCRPPGNRTPLEDEMQACAPYLFRQLAIVRPRIIVALGRPASQTLLCTNTPISRLRGEVRDFPPIELSHFPLPGCKLMPTFHPAYLLRSPAEKAKSWADLQEVMRLLGIPIPKRSG